MGKLMLAATTATLMVGLAAAGCGGGKSESVTFTGSATEPMVKGLYITIEGSDLSGLRAELAADTEVAIVAHPRGPELCHYTNTIKKGNEGDYASLIGKTVTIRVTGTNVFGMMVCQYAAAKFKGEDGGGFFQLGG